MQANVQSVQMSVCLSVCLSVTRWYCVKTTQSIEHKVFWWILLGLYFYPIRFVQKFERIHSEQKRETKGSL